MYSLLLGMSTAGGSSLLVLRRPCLNAMACKRTLSSSRPDQSGNRASCDTLQWQQSVFTVTLRRTYWGHFWQMMMMQKVDHVSLELLALQDLSPCYCFAWLLPSSLLWSTMGMLVAVWFHDPRQKWDDTTKRARYIAQKSTSTACRWPPVCYRHCTATMAVCIHGTPTVYAVGKASEKVLAVALDWQGARYAVLTTTTVRIWSAGRQRRLLGQARVRHHSSGSRGKHSAQNGGHHTHDAQRRLSRSASGGPVVMGSGRDKGGNSDAQPLAAGGAPRTPAAAASPRARSASDDGSALAASTTPAAVPADKVPATSSSKSSSPSSSNGTKSHMSHVSPPALTWSADGSVLGVWPGGLAPVNVFHVQAVAPQESDMVRHVALYLANHLH